MPGTRETPGSRPLLGDPGYVAPKAMTPAGPKRPLSTGNRPNPPGRSNRIVKPAGPMKPMLGDPGYVAPKPRPRSAGGHGNMGVNVPVPMHDGSQRPRSRRPAG